MQSLNGPNLLVLLIVAGAASSFFVQDAKIKQLIYWVLAVLVFIWTLTKVMPLLTTH